MLKNIFSILLLTCIVGNSLAMKRDHDGALIQKSALFDEDDFTDDDSIQEEYFSHTDDPSFHTPIKAPAAKHRCPSSEERDPTYRQLPGMTPQSEIKRAKANSQHISERTVENWPSTLARHELSDTFLTNLAAKTLLTGETLLYIAMKNDKLHCASQRTECIIDLLSHRADVFVKVNGDTPLHRWAMANHTSAREALQVGQELTRIAIPSVEAIKDTNGSTPLHIVCSTGLVNYDKFLALARMGIPLDVRNGQHRTFLHCLAMAGSGIGDHKARIFASLLSLQSLTELANMREWAGKTALILAAKKGDLQMVNFLLAVPGIKIDKADNFGNTALHYTAKNVGKYKRQANTIIHKLIAYGADKGKTNDERLTPVQLVPQKFTRIVHLLTQS